MTTLNNVRHSLSPSSHRVFLADLLSRNIPRDSRVYSCLPIGHNIYFIISRQKTLPLAKGRIFSTPSPSPSPSIKQRKSKINKRLPSAFAQAFFDGSRRSRLNQKHEFSLRHLDVLEIQSCTKIRSVERISSGKFMKKPVCGFHV